MCGMLSKLHRLAHSSTVNVLVGLLTIGAALSELLGDGLGFQISAAHGLLTVGLLHTLKAVPELVAGVHKLAPEGERPER